MSGGEQLPFFGGLPPRDESGTTQTQAAYPPPAPQGFARIGYGYGQPPVQEPRWNTLAIVAFVGSLFIGLLGVIAGAFSLRQIKISGERGKGLALAGIIIGGVSMLIGLVLMIVVVLGIAAAASAARSYAEDSDYSVETPLVEGEPTGEIPHVEGEGGVLADGDADGDLCIALHALTALGTESLNTRSPDAIAALEALAAAGGENQATYEEIVALVKDPGSVEITEQQQLYTDFASALQRDAVACL